MVDLKVIAVLNHGAVPGGFFHQRSVKAGYHVGERKLSPAHYFRYRELSLGVFFGFKVDYKLHDIILTTHDSETQPWKSKDK